MRDETSAAWRLAGWAASVFVVALAFAISAIAWLLLPHDAPIKPCILLATVALVVALLALIGRRVAGQPTNLGQGPGEMSDSGVDSSGWNDCP